MRAHKESIGEPDENTFDGLVALSPYALFFRLEDLLFLEQPSLLSLLCSYYIKLNLCKYTKRQLMIVRQM